jgi:hypothetical protein
MEEKTMREIIFRGKRVDNGEWVEGLLLVTVAGCKAQQRSIGSGCVA